ncbi:hypothetical protein DID76_03775 [Candidatus Marinamargulisbacteria bacterium SCGC AG-414-C22]|nr:hypothetical protein DID76_03775 [Candidatus Marinamargulisbacteria bacterium SCGC AG-414-C22]
MTKPWDNYVSLFGFNITQASLAEVCDSFTLLSDASRLVRVVTLNSQIAAGADQDSNMHHWIATADLIVPDGQGITVAAWLLKKQRMGVVTGVDLVFSLIGSAHYSFYFVGATSAVMNKVISVLNTDYPECQLLGSSHGFLTEEEQQLVIADICQKKPAIILVGMGFPRQELFIQQCDKQGVTGISIGVGGVFDVLAGETTLAPRWVRLIKCEWLYRGFQEPKRLLTWGFLFRYVRLVLRQFFKSIS